MGKTKNVKVVRRVAAQGDYMVIRVDKLPEGYVEVDDLIIAHSETGHHHTAEGGNVKRFVNKDDDMISFLVADGPVEAVHHRDWSTHETLSLDSGEAGEVIWEIHNQRESSIDGWKRAID